MNHLSYEEVLTLEPKSRKKILNSLRKEAKKHAGFIFSQILHQQCGGTDPQAWCAEILTKLEKHRDKDVDPTKFTGKLKKFTSTGSWTTDYYLYEEYLNTLPDRPEVKPLTHDFYSTVADVLAFGEANKNQITDEDFLIHNRAKEILEKYTLPTQGEYQRHATKERNFTFPGLDGTELPTGVSLNRGKKIEGLWEYRYITRNPACQLVLARETSNLRNNDGLIEVEGTGWLAENPSDTWFENGVNILIGDKFYGYSISGGSDWEFPDGFAYSQFKVNGSNNKMLGFVIFIDPDGNRIMATPCIGIKKGTGVSEDQFRKMVQAAEDKMLRFLPLISQLDLELVNFDIFDI